jgi:hypothetical protein
MWSKKTVSDEEIIEACNNSQTMAEAASKFDFHYNTFRRRAKKIGCYKTNQGGRGKTKNRPVVYETSEILDGKVPWFQPNKLKKRLVREGVLAYECKVCGISEWKGSKLSLELDHIDGNSRDHRLENLRLLCPNCHSQTPTFRGRNIKTKNGI